MKIFLVSLFISMDYYIKIFRWDFPKYENLDVCFWPVKIRVMSEFGFRLNCLKIQQFSNVSENSGIFVWFVLFDLFEFVIFKVYLKHVWEK